MDITYEKVRSYIENQRSTLWGRAYNVYSEDTREIAINDLWCIINEIEESSTVDA